MLLFGHQNLLIYWASRSGAKNTKLGYKEMLVGSFAIYLRSVCRRPDKGRFQDTGVPNRSAR